MKNKGFVIISTAALVVGTVIGTVWDLLCGYSVTPYVFDSDITKEAVILLSRRMCITDVLMLLIIAISGYTLFVKPVTTALMFLRGLPLGAVISYIKSTDGISYSLMMPVVTYTAVTLFILFFSHRASEFFGMRNETKGFGAKIRASLAYCFSAMTFAGASILTRVLPLLIYNK